MADSRRWKTSGWIPPPSPRWTANGARQQGLLIKQDSAEDLFGAQSLKLQMRALPAGGDWEISQDLPAGVLQSNRD